MFAKQIIAAMQVTAHINTSTPTGRKILRQLEKHKKTVTIEYPKIGEIYSGKLYTHEEIWSEVEKDLNEHYGTNFKLKY